MTKITFIKMQTLGNDFILLDTIRTRGKVNFSKLASFSADRHFAVGHDGLLVLEKSKKADFKMRMFNPDGSEDMCGNGLRCIAKYIFSHYDIGKEVLFVEAISGIREIRLKKNGKLEVNMGEPILDSIIVKGKKVINQPLKIKGQIMKISVVSMGTPHAVILANSDYINNHFSLSKEIENCRLFSQKVNVDWVEVLDRKNIKIRIWERGVGETLSCGTGGCASVATTKLLNLTNERVKVNFKGGNMDVFWKETENNMYIIGDAEEIYRGYICLDLTKNYVYPENNKTCF